MPRPGAYNTEYLYLRLTCTCVSVCCNVRSNVPGCRKCGVGFMQGSATNENRKCWNGVTLWLVSWSSISMCHINIWTSIRSYTVQSLLGLCDMVVTANQRTVTFLRLGTFLLVYHVILHKSNESWRILKRVIALGSPLCWIVRSFVAFPITRGIWHELIEATRAKLSPTLDHFKVQLEGISGGLASSSTVLCL
jgi:hypothetical protein